jgi:chromosome segregation ATPase
VIALAGVLTALVSSLGAYLMAARRMSGRISTSSASDLWAESRSIREDYREQIARRDARATKLEDRIAACEQLKDTLTNKIAELEGIIMDLKKTVTE